MQSVPKIVADRLRTALPAVNHPDADVLTAFSERSLPDRERDVVIEHLSRCGDCRELVALALPATDPVDAHVHPAPNGWFTWPVLRWGFVTAGILALASFGLLQYRRQAGPSMMALSQPRPQVVAKEAENHVPPIAGVPEPAKGRDKEMAPPVSAVADATVKAGPSASANDELDSFEAYKRPPVPESRPRASGVRSGTSVGGPLRHGPDVQYQSPNSFQYSNNNNGAESNTIQGQASSVPPAYVKQAPNAWISASAPSPSTSQTVQVQDQSQQPDMKSQDQQALVLENKPGPPQPTEGGQGHVVERAKEPGVGVVTNARVPAHSLPPPPNALALEPPSASWTISAGALRRSFDQGKTWQAVDVNGVPPAGANYALVSQTAGANPAETNSELKKDVKADTNKNKELATKTMAVPLLFRAVAANGADVWAGGSSGVLYHSVDSGAHWTRVLPFSGTSILAGDIVRLDFPDTLHGRITTSAPEVWLTNDGGQTWQKQQ